MSVFTGLCVAMVGPKPPPAGGMALQTEQLIELLRREGAEVHMVATNAAIRPRWLKEWRGFRALSRLMHYLPALWRAAGRADLMHIMANSGWSWHLYAVPAVWLAWLRGVPVVVNYRGGAAEPFLARAAGRVRLTMGRCAKLVVPSRFLAEVFARHHMTAEIVPNIVDLSCFQPAPALSRQPRVLVARNLEAVYGLATALHAFALVRERRPDACLVLAGSGPEEGALRKLASGLGLQECVNFLGRLTREQVAEELRRCRVALNPSEVDNMPNAVIEALASGVPVVSTRAGGVPYMVEHGRTALLVPVGDTTAMAAALLRVLEEPVLAEQLRAAGIRDASRWTWEIVGPIWARVYERALSPGRGMAQ